MSFYRRHSFIHLLRLSAFQIVDYNAVVIRVGVFIVDEFWRRRGDGVVYARRFLENCNSQPPSLVSPAVESLIKQADDFVKRDEPSHAVQLLRKARAESGAGVAAVNAHGHARATLACERELVQLLQDIDDQKRWKLHGTRRGATVWVERDDQSPGQGRKLLR